MSNRLTKKQKGFVKEYAKTGNGVQSALKAYDTDDYATAGVIAVENLEKPKIQNALDEALPDELLTDIHREGLLATRPFFNDDGDKVAEDADYNVRHKYLDTAYKLKGSYAPEKRVTLNVQVEPTEQIQELANNLNDAQRHNITGHSGGDEPLPSTMGTPEQDKK